MSIHQTTGAIKSIDYGATGDDAKLQCIEFALSTIENTLFLDREFGWEPPISEPMNEVAPVHAGEVATLLLENIDGIVIDEIDFEMNSDTGHVKPIVKVVIEDD